MAKIELRRLRYFLVLAEELHFGRAAARLNMAQPPLSEQIRKLEDELGFRLFQRTSRSVALTDAGRVFLDGARRATDELARAAQAGQQVELGLAGYVRIGFVSSGGVTFLPKLLRRLREALPQVRTPLRQYSSTGAIEALIERTIDMAIVRTPVVGGQLAHRVLLRDPVVLAIANDHPLAGRKRVALAALNEERFVLYPPNEGHAAYNVVQKACLAAGFIPSAAEFVDDIYGMLGMVSAGVGVALMPAAISQLNVEGVVFHALPEVKERFELSVVWRDDDDRAVVKALARELADGAKSPPVSRRRAHRAAPV